MNKKLSPEINLPIDLLVWVMKDGVIKPGVLKTFLFIKMEFPDRFQLSPSIYQGIATGLNVTVKTARQHIQTLISVKFLGFDKNTSTIYVRSIRKIIPTAQRKTRYHIKVWKEYLEHFTEFIVAAAIAYLVKRKRILARKLPALKNDGAFRSNDRANLKYNWGYQISLSYLAVFLNRQMSWVDKYKQKAIRLGWMRRKRWFDETNVEWTERFQFLKFKEIAPGRARRHKGRLELQGIDILQSFIVVQKGKKV